MAAGTGAMFRARNELDARLLLQELHDRHGHRPPHSRAELARLAGFGGLLLGTWGLATLVA